MRGARLATWFFALALAARLLHLGQIRRAPFFDLMLGDAASYDAWARRIAPMRWDGCCCRSAAACSVWPWSGGWSGGWAARHSP